MTECEYLRIMREREKIEWKKNEIMFPKIAYRDSVYTQTFLAGDLVETMCETMSYKDLRNMVNYIIDKLPYAYNKERKEQK